MANKMYNGVTVEVNEEGYFTNPQQWAREMAPEIAKEEGIEITEKHYEVLMYLRDRYLKGETLTIRGLGKSGIVDIKGLYDLFPGGPLKKSSRIAGIPKPVSCV